MRLEFLTLLATLAATCAADSLALFEGCLSFTSQNCRRERGVFFTSNGGYNVDANDGCRGTSVPGMVEFCIDWANNRGRFRFSHQSSKRCLALQARLHTNMCDGCSLVTWKEVASNWRQMHIEPEATESALPGLPTTTLVPIPRTSSQPVENNIPVSAIPGNITFVASSQA
ncbi:hypothetical protein MFIFM68171_10117 [Madurella fahalii]|uniref:Uncharacterized protein n=1 Tax=Madurella fahalii TaxID=1157608 RepID=A0ABQ0GQA0_9PEZI